MCTLNKIEQLIKEKNKNQKELCTFLGISKQAFSEWKAGRNASYKKYLPQIADFFGITVDELIGNGSTPAHSKFTSIDSTQQSEYTKKYRSLDDYGKRMVDTVLNLEYERCNNEPIQEEVKNIDVPYCLYKVSAGTGFELDDIGTWETITVPNTPLMQRVAFAVTVQGDSMEPKFKNGDCVFVQQTDDIDVGDIGIFCIDGLGYIKKRGADKLISLNKNYSDISIGEFDNVTCFGRVIGKL